MNFLSNLWNRFTLAADEFIAGLLGEDEVDQLEINSQELATMVETDSFESW